MTSISTLEAHGIPVTAHGKPLETTTVVYNVDQLRSLLDLGLNAEGREAHYQALFGGVSTLDEVGASLTQRVSAHVIGNGQVSQEDNAAVATAFPLTVHVAASAQPLTVTGRYDLSTPDGSPKIVSFTDVILEQGGYFVCEATPLMFTCDTLTRKGNAGTGGADFNILGKTGTTPGTPGPAPNYSSQAGAGYNGECSSAGIAGHGGGTGTNGGPGNPGTPGGNGGPGVPSMQATITITTTLVNPISIFTQSGPGGKGGNGGQGGAGQQGGNGGNGVTCDCTGNAGGQGGEGGPGGKGGRAGNGGNGTDAAANIQVWVPSAGDVPRVIYTSSPAAPGKAGDPGHGGAGGAGGTGGSGGKNNSGGGSGGSRNPGPMGDAGDDGAVPGVAASVTVSPR
ncbi:MAG TPA: hypothetical protein VHZ03_18760 [Trebonia sp.]|jgi:hypothetical protein|nr:hypothetical protein [Trebonia sp.]